MADAHPDPIAERIAQVMELAGFGVVYSWG